MVYKRPSFRDLTQSTVTSCTIGTVNIKTVSSQCPAVSFAKLVSTDLWAVSNGRATCTVHQNFALQTSQEGIKCTKAKEQLRSYCLIYILWLQVVQQETLFCCFIRWARTLKSCKSTGVVTHTQNNNTCSLESVQTLNCKLGIETTIGAHLESAQNVLN